MEEWKRQWSVISFQLPLRNTRSAQKMTLRTALVGLLVVCLVPTPPVSATTCLPGKKFKVSQVCGVITGKDHAPVSSVKIKLVAMDDAHNARLTESDQHGRFAFISVPNGDYDIQMDSANFWPTLQVFAVVRSHESDKCTEPIRVVLKSARQPGCSYVENAWLDLKK